jgi:dUTP pyrophosphatase
MVVVKFKRVEGNEDISLPKYQTDGAAAFDLHAAVKDTVVLKPGERSLIPTGFMMELPKGYVALILSRSSLGLKHGVSMVNSVGVIDSDYRGQFGVLLINHGTEPFKISRNDRIAQMMIQKHEHAEIVEAAELSETARGAGGFGSTGR